MRGLKVAKKFKKYLIEKDKKTHMHNNFLYGRGNITINRDL